LEIKDYELTVEMQKYSRRDPNFTNLLEVLGTPKGEIDGAQRGLLKELKDIKHKFE